MSRSLNYLGSVHAPENTAVVAETFQGSKVEAKATVTSRTRPLDECHTLTLLVAMTATEVAADLAGSPHGVRKGLDVARVEGGTRREVVSDEFVVEGADPLAKGLSTTIVMRGGHKGQVADYPGSCSDANDAFFDWSEILSGGEHCVRN